MSVIPFYGAEDRDLFSIERAAMDRPGRVLDALDEILPSGTVLDIGAGDGFTALRLTRADRTVIALEPAAGMIEPSRPLPWVAAVAQHLPFADQVFDAVYATWAYFFPSNTDIRPGLQEAARVTRPDGRVVIVDNAGGDEFSEQATADLSTDLAYWRSAGFEVTIVETAFVFNSIEDAQRLLGHFFGDQARPQLEQSFRVAVMTAEPSVIAF